MAVGQLHFGAGDSVTFGTTGSTTASTANASSSALSNIAVGDLLVAVVHNQNATVGTITPPSGWTHFGANSGSPSGAVTRNTGIYYFPIKAASDITGLPATLTWSFSGGAGRIAGVLARATGVDLDNIEDAAATTFSSGTANSSTFDIAAITTVKSTTLLVGVAFHQNAASTTSPNTTAFMTGFQEYRTNANGTVANTGLAMAYYNSTSAGSTGPISVNLDNTAAVLSGELVAFQVGDWSPPSGGPTGVAVKFTSATDTLADGHLFYTSATDTLAGPNEVRPFPTGYASVASMLATSPFYVAHRGGSDDWPEMSLHAYTQAGFWGVGALELSLARTSDGVWFGMHDASLDRTSLGTGGGSGTTLVASSMTWAQVQAYSILGSTASNNPTQSSRPYMRWEEIIAAYYNTHVIFVDPKVALSFRSELLDMMDACPGTPTDRFVAKFYGVTGNAGNTSGWPFDARSRGYKTWGYFYQADSANFATYQGRWDILGMDYTASAGTWTSILSYGKPVIGHTIGTAANATTAFGLGASGVMVSGVQASVPRST